MRRRRSATPRGTALTRPFLCWSMSQSEGAMAMLDVHSFTTHVPVTRKPPRSSLQSQ